MTLAANLPATRSSATSRRCSAPGATFRDGQREAIDAVVRDGSRTLVVERTGWGKSLVYWIATRVRRDQGHGPDADRQPAAVADAEPDRGRGPARPARRHDQLGQPRRLGLDRGGPRRRPDRRPVRLRAAVRERGLQRAAAAGDPALDRDVRGRRGALHQRLGPRVRARTTAASGGCCPSLGHDVPVLGTTATANDRVVEDVARQLGEDVVVIRGPLARDSLDLDAIPLRDQAERLAWLAEHLPGHARRRDRLLPHGRRHATGLGLAPGPWHRRPSVQRRHRPRGARGARAGPAREPAQGAGRDGRPRDGLRQARPRLRRPLPAPGLADRLLPAGRPRRAGGRARVRDPPVGSRGRRDRRVLPLDRVPADGADAGDPGGAGEGRLRDDPRPPGPGQPAVRADREGAQAARGRRRRREGPWPVRADGDALGAGRGVGRGRARGAPPRARVDAGVRRHDGLPDGVPRAAAQRPGRRAVRALRERRRDPLAAGPWTRGSCGMRWPSSGATCGASTRAASGRRRRRSRSPTSSAARCACSATRGGGGTWPGPLALPACRGRGGSRTISRGRRWR